MLVEAKILARMRSHDDGVSRIVGGHLFDQNNEISEIMNVPMPLRVPDFGDACLTQILRPKHRVHLAAERIVSSLRVVRRSEPSAHQYVRTVLLAFLLGFLLRHPMKARPT